MSYKIVSDWARANSEMKKHEQKVDQQFQSAIEHFWPTSNRYFSTIPTFYLFAVKDYRELNKSAEWMARDGIIPLSWFFTQNPVPPKNLKTKIYIHHACQSLVPKAWAKHMASYQMKPHEGVLTAKRSKLLVTGLMSKNYVDIHSLKKQLSKISALLAGQNIEIQDYALFTPARYVGYGVEHDHSYHFEYAAEVVKAFGANYKFYKWQQFEFEQNFSDYYVVDLNSHFVVSDNYCVQHAITRGAVFLNPDLDSGQSGREIPAGKGHSWLITDLKFESSRHDQVMTELEKSQEYYDYMIDNGLAEVQSRFPWPQWVEEWGVTQASR